MRRTLVTTIAAAAAITLCLPAGAAPAVPAPTAGATFETVDASEVGGPEGPVQPQPAMTAKWTAEPKRGRDATLTITGNPVPVFTGHADAVWTSAPLVVKRKGKVATISMAWSGIQEDPYGDGVSNQIVRVRFTDAKGRWGVWVPLLDKPLTAPLDPGTQRSLVVPVMYRGPLPMKALQFQVQVADTFAYVLNLTHTVRITT